MKNKKNNETKSRIKEKIEERAIGEEMQDSYLDYAMSVIVSRALPDVRDGLKPVQRRILYAAFEDGLHHNAKFRKSASIIGSVLARYHPHGDMAVYDALARMAQDFSLRYPLIEGQGNFGCFTKDTKVKISDGRDLSFKELIEEYKKGKKYQTFTFNHKTKKIEISEIKNPRLTRKNERIIEIILDNKEKIKSTLDHLFMLEDGSYKQAKDLKPGDSLMGFSTKKVTKTKVLFKKEDVYDLTTEPWHNFALSAGVFVHNSIDGDKPAAYRYTEARLSEIGEEMLKDIEKNTIDFIPNYDGTRKEPVVLPARIPLLLLNGVSGIAVGVATNIPPHNLSEICDALIYLIDHPEAEISELMNFILGPDFPTGGIVFGGQILKDLYSSGRGKIVIRAKTEIFKKDSINQIIIKEIPYLVEKRTILEKIAQLIEEKKILEIKNIRDLSDKEGIRIVIDLKKEAHPEKVLNYLFNFTPLETSFYFNFLALVEGLEVKTLSLKDILKEYINHRQNVIKRRTEWELDKVIKRIHVLEGFKKALANLSLVIKIIKESKDKEKAKISLIEKLNLTESQTNAILELRLWQLSKLERQKIKDELEELKKKKENLSLILAQPKKILDLIKEDLIELKKKYGDERRTKIVKTVVEEFKEEDFISDKPTIVVITQDSYLKRVSPEQFRVQERGGKGTIILKTKENHLLSHLIFTSTLSEILFFTNSGKVFKLKTYEIPEKSKTSKGEAIANFFSLNSDEKITSVLAVSSKNYFSSELSQKFLIIATKKGMVKRIEIENLKKIRKSGLVVIGLEKDDSLISVKPSTGEDEIILVSRNGQGIRFSEKEIRKLSREAKGLRGIKLSQDDELIALEVLPKKKSVEAKIFSITEFGYGKLSPLSFYRSQKRGGSGIKIHRLTEKTGKLVKLFFVDEKNFSEFLKGDLIIASLLGQILRISLKSIPILGRVSQGVKLIKLKDKKDKVASVILL